MSTWHHSTCREPDVATVDGIPTCKSCGFAYIRNQTEAVRELSVVVPKDQNGAGELKLAWPSTITFSQLESLPANSEVRHQLENLAVHRGRDLAQREYMRDQPLNMEENEAANGARFQCIDAVVRHGCDVPDSHPTENSYHGDFDADDDCFIESLKEDFQREVGSLMEILALDLQNRVQRPTDKPIWRKSKPRKCLNQHNIPALSISDLRYQSRTQQALMQPSWLPQSQVQSNVQSKQTQGVRDDKHWKNEDQFLKLDLVYESLRGTDQIRLLYLSPGSKKAELKGRSHAKPLHGHLRHASLSERPKFTAVSYTWASESGDRRMSETIFLGDSWEPLPITSNCAGALRQLRHPTETRVLWIDAVCINQLNGAEKTHQVGLMRDVYSSADLVKIYLGWDGRYTKNGPKRVRDSLFCDGNVARLTQADYDDVEALFAQHYWSRIWVVQEVFLAKEAVLLIGNSSIPFSSILRTAFNSYFPTWISLAQESRAGRVSPLGNAESFSELLFATSFCNSTDPRDRIFALLGLVQGAKMEGLVADYSQTAAEIYVGLTAYFLIKYGQFGLLKLAAIENRSPIGIDDDTVRRFAAERPSWVPTWDYAVRTDLYSVEQRLVKHCIDHWNPEELTWDHKREKWVRNEEDIWDKVRNTWVRTKRRVMRALLETLTPSSHSRRTSARTEDVGPATRVFQSSGALLVSAYCVLDLDMALDGADFVTERPGVGLILQHQGSSLVWRLHIVSDLGSIEREDRFIEVPGCDSFLHLKPAGPVPGPYRIASMCIVAFVADQHPGLVPLLSRPGISSSCELHRLLNRLVPFHSRDLQYLEEWRLAMATNKWLVPSRLGKNTHPFTQGLSAPEMNQYRKWLTSITQYPNPISDQEVTPEDLDQIFEKLSFYLDEWQDVSLWRRICGLLKAVDWQQYLAFLKEMRFRLCQHFLDGSIKDDVEMTNFYRHTVHRKLGQLLIDVSRVLPLEGVQLYFGDLGLSDAVAEVCDGDVVEIHRNMVFGAGETDDAIFGSWLKLESFLRHLLRSQGDSKGMLNKFTQRQVLKQLYTRWEPRDYLIH